MTGPATSGAPAGPFRRRLTGVASNRPLLLTATDQIASSTSNFVIGVLVGRLAGPSAYGAYILAFTVWLVVLGIHRALVGEPIVIARTLDEDRHGALRRGLVADALLALALGAVVAAIGGVLMVLGSGTVGASLVVLALLLPLLIAQDYWRAMAFALHRPGVALANDLVFVGVQVVALVVVIMAGGRTAPWFLLAWGLGAAAGAVLGFFQFGVHPFRASPGPLFSHTWPFSRWLLADFLTIFAVDQTYVLLVAGLLGQAAFGGLKAALSLMGPTAVILLTGGNVGLPTLSRAHARDGVDGLVHVARKLTRLVGAAVLAYCAVVFVFGPWLLTWIYGPEFASSGNLTRIGALMYAVGVGSFGAGIAIRVAREARRMWTARLFLALLSAVSVVVLAWAFGITGAAWAGVVTATAGTIATLRVFHAYVARARRAEASAPEVPAWPPPVAGTAAARPPVPDDVAWPPPGPGAGMVLGLSAAEGQATALEGE